MHAARRLPNPFLLLALCAALLAVPVADATAQDGAFRVQFIPADDPDLDGIRVLLQESGAYDELIDQINDAIALPVDVIVSFQSGDGPYFDPDQRAIVMNYDFAAVVAELFLQEDPEMSDDELIGAVLDTFDFVLFHEVGHALISVLDLPVVGREEDAVDSLGAVLSAELVGNAELALGAAITFDLLASQSGTIEDDEFWGEHSLGEQRYFSILCWAYGADPDTLSYLVEDEWLPEERAEQCPAEYAQQADSWLELLDDALRE